MLYCTQHLGFCTVAISNILDSALLPFIQHKYSNSHQFMADNDPKHTSKLAQGFLAERNVNWFRTPAESPDLNPIENLWHELKEYMRREVKPKIKEELHQWYHEVLEYSYT